MPRVVLLGITVLLGAGLVSTALLADSWSTLEDDGLHDASNPSIRLLQDPEEALSVLAPDTAGNKVNWVEAVRQGQIQPRTSIDGSREPEQHETDVIMKNTLSLPAVMFPHDAHNLWMSCEMCHDKIFKAEIDGNDINMSKILDGEYCGLCHGAVSFPWFRCRPAQPCYRERCFAHLPRGRTRPQ